MADKNHFFTLTFRECGENHVGNQKIYGKCKGEIITLKDLREIKKRFKKVGAKCELIRLNRALPDDITSKDEAAVLIIRNGLKFVLNEDNGADILEKELLSLRWDSKYYSTYLKKAVNKNARHNLCFGDKPQKADYESGKGTIVAYKDVPTLDALRTNAHKFFLDKSKNAVGEGNYYYDGRKCGIGAHGDSETNAGVYYAVRVGMSGWISWCWFERSIPIGQRVDVELCHGDMYVMNLKASGWDWKKKIIPTLRHAAAADINSKYLIFGKGENAKKPVTSGDTAEESDGEYLIGEDGYVIVEIVR